MVEPGEHPFGYRKYLCGEGTGRYYAKVSSVACEAVATTFVGPSIAVRCGFICSGSLSGRCGQFIRPDLPPYLALPGSYQKRWQQERTFIEDAYELNLDTDELEGFGELYHLF